MSLEKNEIYYLVGLIVTSILMVLILFSGVLSLYLTFLIFFWVMKFLSGFGLILSITNGFLFLLKKSKDKISKRGTNALIIIQIIVPILLIIYAMYKVFSSYMGSASTLTMTGIWADLYVWFDNLIYIWGILSLLLNLYILPLVRKEFDKAINKGRNQKLGQNFRHFGRNIKKNYLGWREEYAKAQYLDQKIIKELLDNWRDRFSVVLLIPLAIGAFIFTPISMILIVMWFKIIIFDRSPIKSYEKIALLISIIIIGLIAILVPYIEFGIYSAISTYLWSINIFYLIGIVLAAMLFMVKLLGLQGVSISGYFKARKQKKKENMKQSIKDLKNEKKSLEKELKGSKSEEIA